MRCAVKGFNNNNNKNNKAMPCKINFFSFPTNPALQKQWKSFCAREKTMNVNTSSICMEHFQQDDFENNLEYEMGFTKRRFLKQGAIPTIKKIRAASNILYKEREERIKKRENKKTVELLLKEYDATSHSVDETCAKALDTDVAIDNSTNADNIEEILLNSTLNKNDPIAFDNIENIPCNSENVVENDEINRLKSQLKCLLKENIELKKAQKRKCSELSATIEKAEKDAKIHEYNVEALQCRLTKAHFELKNLEEKLLTIFTKGQITKLKAGIKRPTWSEEDIAQSITLYAASAKLYKLLYRKKFPLPSVRTLQKWAQKVDVSNGMIKPVFKLLSASTQMTEQPKH